MLRVGTALVVCLGFWVAVLTYVPHAFAEIHEGMGVLANWDFSDSTQTVFSGPWDISIEIVAV